ncbi:MAG: SlyX family protein [Pseudomonadota bacterium]
MQTMLEDLQSQLAFQEDTVQSLNDAVASQQQQLMLLQRQLELLKQRQDEQAQLLDQASNSPTGDEPPPHY